MPRKILIVDDEAPVRELLTEIVKDLGFDATSATDGEDALSWLATEEFEVVFSDLMMPVMSGMELLKLIARSHPGVACVMVTAYGTVEKAVEAMRLGAVDFLIKPFSIAQIKSILERIFKSREIEDENRKLREILKTKSPAPELVGDDIEMKKVYQLIEKVGPTDATVLIQGESGTGKELVAKAIHGKSGRPAEKFVAINCVAVAENLLENEIFGHEIGSFTGAGAKKLGLMEVASGGTLFLDEIGETPPSFQAKLLRALQEKEFYRVGGTKPVKVDTRILAATNRNLKEEVASGRFREDLYYRLSVFPITVPPLRERKGDIVLLARHFLTSLGSGKSKTPPSLAPETEGLLSRYSWPGNIRELGNVIERAVILSGSGIIKPEHLPSELGANQPRSSELTRLVDLPFREAKAQLEARYLKDLLREFGGNVSQSADHAGLARGTLHEKLNKLGIDPGEFR